MTRVFLGLLACAACNNVFGLGEVPTRDKAIDARFDVDARVLKPFGVPRAITELNTDLNDEDPTVTADQLEIIFASSRPGTIGLDDLWASTRPNLSSAWGTPVNITELNSPNTDLHPQISPDGLTIYLSSDRPGGTGLADIYEASRATRTSPWSTPVLVPELSSGAPDLCAAPDATGLLLVLTSMRRTGADADLYLSTRAATGDVWSPPQLIVPLTSDLDDTDGIFAYGGLALYFTRGTAGSRDLYLARRASIADEFDAPGAIDELNRPDSSDLDPWVSEDEQAMIMNSSRGGTEDLYETHRLP